MLLNQSNKLEEFKLFNNLCKCHKFKELIKLLQFLHISMNRLNNIRDPTIRKSTIMKESIIDILPMIMKKKKNPQDAADLHAGHFLLFLELLALFLVCFLASESSEEVLGAIGTTVHLLLMAPLLAMSPIPITQSSLKPQ